MERRGVMTGGRVARIGVRLRSPTRSPTSTLGPAPITSAQHQTNHAACRRQLFVPPHVRVVLGHRLRDVAGVVRRTRSAADDGRDEAALEANSDIELPPIPWTV